MIGRDHQASVTQGLVAMSAGLTRHAVVRYLLVGASLFLIDLLVFMVLTLVVGIHPALSQLTSRAVGATVGFVGHRHYTFRHSLSAPRLGLFGQGGGYLALSLLTFFSSPVILMAILHATGDRPLVSKLMTEAILVCITYVAMKFIFRSRAQA